MRDRNRRSRARYDKATGRHSWAGVFHTRAAGQLRSSRDRLETHRWRSTPSITCAALMPAPQHTPWPHGVPGAPVRRKSLTGLIHKRLHFIGWCQPRFPGVVPQPDPRVSPEAPGVRRSSRGQGWRGQIRGRAACMVGLTGHVSGSSNTGRLWRKGVAGRLWGRELL